MTSTHRYLVAPMLGLSLAACSYDLDKVFETSADAGTTNPTELPADLIDLWKAPSVTEACRACAREKCVDTNTECRDDEECAALTRCVAKAVDPANQNDCRAQHLAYLKDDVAGRDTGGPYQQCVFLNECVAECDARNEDSCTGSFTWPSTSAATVELHLRFVDGFLGTPPPGLRARACQAEDSAECREVASWQPIDESGVVSLKVPATLGSFRGYLELEGDDLYPTLLRFAWPVARDMVTGVAVVNTFSANALVRMAPVKLDATRGLLQLRSFGCGGVPLRGVSFTVDNTEAGISTWYTVGQDIQPRFDVAETGDRGAGGLVNVPAGRSTVTATRNGVAIASSSAPVRAGFMTIVVMMPSDTSSR